MNILGREPRGRPDKESLFRSAPVQSAVVMAGCCASSVVAALFSRRYGSEDELAIGLTAVFIVVNMTSVILCLGRPCISLPPRSPGKAVFVWSLWWTTVQLAGFGAVAMLWSDSWPGELRNLGVAWMAVTAATMVVWAAALGMVARRWHAQRVPPEEDIESASLGPRSWPPQNGHAEPGCKTRHVCLRLGRTKTVKDVDEDTQHEDAKHESTTKDNTQDEVARNEDTAKDDSQGENTENKKTTKDAAAQEDKARDKGTTDEDEDVKKGEE